MMRLLILILAMFVVAAPVPALAARAMCADAMPAMASMDHAMKKGSCCDEKNKACMLACDAMCAVALATPAPQPVVRTVDVSVRPLSQLTSFTIAKLARGLDRPPRIIV